MHGGVPVDHVRVGLGAAEQPISAGALEELLKRAVRESEREVDVSADDVEEAREAVARLGEARGGLLAGGDVGDDALDEHAAVGLRARAGAISKRARDSVETDEPVGRLGILAAQQALVERFVERPVRGRDPRLPERSLLDAFRERPADQALDGDRRLVVDVAAVLRDLPGVDVLLEEVEDPRQPHVARAAAVPGTGAEPPHGASQAAKAPGVRGHAQSGALRIGMGRRTNHGSTVIIGAVLGPLEVARAS